MAVWWQGLIYPLTVASKSQSAPRKGAAMRVLAEMRKRCDTLVEQAAVVAAAVAARDGGGGASAAAAAAAADSDDDDDDDDDRDQAALVSSELIRVSILWHEMWHAALEDASRLYFELGDVDGMMTALDPLHAVLQGGAETMREESFQQARDPRDRTCNLRDDLVEPRTCMPHCRDERVRHVRVRRSARSSHARSSTAHGSSARSHASSSTR